MTTLKNPFIFFDEKKFLAKVEAKMADQPFYKKYLSLKRTLVPLSYIFAVISCIGLVFGAFYVSELLFGNYWAAIGIAALFGYYFEKLKRMSSTEFWQYFWFKGMIHKFWLILTLVLFVASLLASAYGMKKGTNELAAPPDIIAANDQALKYEAENKKLQAEIAEDEKNVNDQNEVYWNFQKIIKAKEETIAANKEEIRRLNIKTEDYNDVLTEAHKAEVDITGKVFVGITILFEFLFEFCIGFIWYFYARVSMEEKENLSPTLGSNYPNILDIETLFENKLANMTAQYEQRLAEQTESEQNLKKIILSAEQKQQRLAEQLAEQKLRNKLEQKKWKKLARKLESNNINGSVPSPN